EGPPLPALDLPGRLRHHRADRPGPLLREPGATGPAPRRDGPGARGPLPGLPPARGRRPPQPRRGHPRTAGRAGPDGDAHPGTLHERCRRGLVDVDSGARRSIAAVPRRTWEWDQPAPTAALPSAGRALGCTVSIRGRPRGRPCSPRVEELTAMSTDP